MTKGKIILIQKDLPKGNILSNYRPGTCSPLMWKILTTQTEKGNLLLAGKLRIISRRTKSMLKKNKWSTRPANPQQYYCEVGKCTLWYGPANVDNKKIKNIHNIRQNHKFRHECYRNIFDGIEM